MEQPPLHPHHHAVQFYGNDASLFKTVSGFLAEGLTGGEPTIIIATPGHREAILSQIADRLIDVEKARTTGHLVVLDAKDTLATFMVAELPDADAFDTSVGGVVRETLLRRKPRTILRAYGEMVDVLWKQNREDAAIQLEMLWNELALKYGFALLCGYAMGPFYKQTSKFEDVCRQHTHVMAPDTAVVPSPPRAAVTIA